MRGGHLCCFWDQSPWQEFFMGSLFKRGRTRGRTSEHRHNVWETKKDIRTHQKGQAFITVAYGQFLKNSMRESEKSRQKRNRCNKHTSASEHFSPTPRSASCDIQAQSSPPALLQQLSPTPHFSSGFQAGALLSCLSSQDAVPFLPGQNPFERNPGLKIFVN